MAKEVHCRYLVHARVRTRVVPAAGCTLSGTRNQRILPLCGWSHARAADRLLVARVYMGGTRLAPFTAKIRITDIIIMIIPKQIAMKLGAGITASARMQPGRKTPDMTPVHTQDTTGKGVRRVAPMDMIRWNKQVVRIRQVGFAAKQRGVSPWGPGEEPGVDLPIERIATRPNLREGRSIIRILCARCS
jgi:hypothetical protein